MSPFREFGGAAGCVYLIDEVLSRMSSHLRLIYYELMVQPIPDTPLLPRRLTKSLEFREIREGDADTDLLPIRPEIKESRFAQGTTCLGTYKQNELIGYIWFSFKTYQEDEIRCDYLIDPEDAAVFDFDLYLFPQHRLGLGFAGVWSGANKYLRSKGIRYTYSRVSRFNTASRRAHAHFGWEKVGRCLTLKLWNVELMCCTIRPWFHLAVSKNSRAEIRMTADVLAASDEPSAT